MRGMTIHSPLAPTLASPRLDVQSPPQSLLQKVTTRYNSTIRFPVGAACPEPVEVACPERVARVQNEPSPTPTRERNQCIILHENAALSQKIPAFPSPILTPARRRKTNPGLATCRL